MRSFHVLVLFLASASLTVAQHHSGGGGGPPENEEEIPCFVGFEPPPELISIFFGCSETVGADVYSKYANSPELEKKMEEGLADCILTNGGYLLSNGSLDIDKIMGSIDNLQSKVFLARKRLISMGHLCMLNITRDSGMKEFRGYVKCVKKESDDFCALQRGKLKAYWQMANRTSPCASVQLPKEFYEINDTCYAQTRPADPSHTSMQKGCRRHGQSRPIKHSASDGDSTDQTQSLQEELALQLCVDEGLGTYSPESGYNYTRLIENINNLTGWEEIPEILTNLNMAMEACVPTYKGDLLAQTWQWESCVTLPVIDICGFDNVATSMTTYELDKEMALYAKAVADLQSGHGGM